MTTLLGTIVLAASSLFSLATSWSSFRAPRPFAERLGFTIPGADGLNEVRAQYGGFFLAVAASGGAALAGLIPRQAGLIVAGTVFGGLILGRLVSLVLDGGAGNYGATIRALFFIDSFGLAAVIAAVAVEAAH
jgi:hypothetical protein